MKISKIALLASAMFLSSAVAQEPALGFKDLLLGEPIGNGPIGRLLKCWTSTACLYGGALGPRVIEGRPTIGGVETIQILVALNAGRIELINVRFSHEAYETVRDGLREKFGPLTCDQSVVQNLGGARLDNESCRALGTTGIVTVEKRRVDMETAVFEVMSYAAAKRAEEDKKKNKKDF